MLKLRNGNIRLNRKREIKRNKAQERWLNTPHAELSKREKKKKSEARNQKLPEA